MLLSLQCREWLEYFVISVRRRRHIFVTGDVIWDYCCLRSRARPPLLLPFIVMRKTLITIYNPSHAKVAPIFTRRFLPKQFIAASLTWRFIHAACKVCVTRVGRVLLIHSNALVLRQHAAPKLSPSCQLWTCKFCWRHA
jgi:TRAP-type C4-dicarboxylate transport system permease large subunit